VDTHHRKGALILPVLITQAGQRFAREKRMRASVSGPFPRCFGQIGHHRLGPDGWRSSDGFVEPAGPDRQLKLWRLDQSVWVHHHWQQQPARRCRGQHEPGEPSLVSAGHPHPRGRLLLLQRSRVDESPQPLLSPQPAVTCASLASHEREFTLRSVEPPDQSSGFSRAHTDLPRKKNGPSFPAWEL